MPLLDVSQVINDPDFCSLVTITRRKQITNDYGEPETQEHKFNRVSGVLINTTNSIVREDSGQYAIKGLSFYTTFRIIGVNNNTAGEAYAPDILTWHNNNYLVGDVLDYSMFGAGFVVARLESYDYIADVPFGAKR